MIKYCLILLFFTACAEQDFSNKIDREALVSRHNIQFSKIDTASIPQVGNGEIAFGIDVTGLQTLYGNTLSQWGWHTAPLPKGKSIEDFTMTEVTVHGRTPTYPVSKEGQNELYYWLRKNPHRLNLGKLSFILDGELIKIDDITAINQKLDLWQGVIYSNYMLKGIPVSVVTACHPESDALIVSVKSTLLSQERLTIALSFPYGHPENLSGADWTVPEKHQTILEPLEQSATFLRKLDQDEYAAYLKWDSQANLKQSNKHVYHLQPVSKSDQFSFVCEFSKDVSRSGNLGFEESLDKVKEHWQNFWKSGGAIDFSDSQDMRWKELERRVVLSQYLLAVNEAGSLPPQESGLLLNSNWYGKFHLEMHWWHGAHYQLWDRWDLFDRSLNWYKDILPEARKIAERQGYDGVRWPKMVGPDGRFGPSHIGPWLIWQQPHPIFYAEQNYRIDPSDQTLRKWEEIIFETAEFMASYAFKNEKTGRYELGPWLINAAENNEEVIDKTINPAFELAYWRYGLDIACKWRDRMGLPENKKWLDVLNHLAPLPSKDSVYVMFENVENMWSDFNNSHIDVIGAGAFLPMSGVDEAIFNKTIDKVIVDWKMNSTWGWDFPWLAMASARAGQPQVAIEALLMDSPKNTYSKCGINEGGPANTYFPGNGGLLYAVAMMAAGWDGGPNDHAPGFPSDGSWTIKHEGLFKAQ